MLSVINWNLEWKPKTSRAGKAMASLISESRPNIACLTESFTGFLDQQGLIPIYADSDYGYPQIEGRRKVALWSRSSWSEVTTTLPGAPTGRFVSGLTNTAIGPVRVHGVCIPWEAAHVSTGRRDRSRWEDHCTFIEALSSYANLVDQEHPTILIGDFNQTIPPRRAPEQARAVLDYLLTKFERASPRDAEMRVVCHTLHTLHFRARGAVDLPKSLPGLRLTDHNGHQHTLDLAG
jgi:exonuclease III